MKTIIPTLMIRPIRPSDAAELVRFHESLSPETKRLRFFSPHPHLLPYEVDSFTHVDGADRCALVALVGAEIVGVARYDRDTETVAEVAIVVRDDLQERGIATALLQRLASHAHAVGITRLVAVTLPENERVRSVFHDLRPGTTSRFENGVIKVTIPLVPDQEGQA